MGLILPLHMSVICHYIQMSWNNTRLWWAMLHYCILPLLSHVNENVHLNVQDMAAAFSTDTVMGHSFLTKHHGLVHMSRTKIMNERFSGFWT